VSGPARIARAERLGDYFELQLRFAECIAGRASMAIDEAVTRYTNLHRRFGLGVIGDAPPSADWTRYVRRLTQLGSAGERLAWTQVFYVTCPEEAPSPGQTAFGCFSCEAPNEEGAIRIHFNNNKGEAGQGPLSRSNAPLRIDELRAMFAFIRQAYPAAKSVNGASWLYNIEAYRRLFPPDYAASRRLPKGPVRLTGTSNWGQFLDHRGSVKPDLRRQFLDNLETLDVDAPWRAFPLPSLRTRAPMESFYGFYGV